MGLSWQQGPLAPGSIGHFLVPDPLPERMLYAEPLRRRMRVRFGGAWIADSEDVVLLHEPGRYRWPIKGARSLRRGDRGCYYDVGGGSAGRAARLRARPGGATGGGEAHRAAWSYADPYTEVARISGLTLDEAVP